MVQGQQKLRFGEGFREGGFRYLGCAGREFGFDRDKGLGYYCLAQDR